MNRIALAALAAGTVPIPTYKFQVGAHVQWSQPYRHMAADIYEIVKQFPESNGEFHYRIKGFHEQHARMATESELCRLSDHHEHSLVTAFRQPSNNDLNRSGTSLSDDMVVMARGPRM